MEKRPGRPPSKKRKAKTLQIRLTEEERQKVIFAALSDGSKKPSQWAREKLLALLPDR
ncbi:MAG: hypothetical protein WAK31_27780 [Chthoniobacterales bacterium]